MARRRYNGLSAALGADLAIGATAITFDAALKHSRTVSVPTLSGGSYIPFSIFDSNGHLSEIVHLTAYTLGATTGTIVRARENTTAVAHLSGDKMGCVYTKADLNGDPPPFTPGTYDDEFDGSSSVTWSSTPTAPNAFDIDTTSEHRAYLKASGSGAVHVGKLQAVPGAYPYTIEMKFNGTSRGNYHRGGGVLLAPAGATNSSNGYYAGAVYVNGRAFQRILTTLGGTFGSQSTAALAWNGDCYVRVVVNSATSVDFYASTDNRAWVPVELGVNPGFTPGLMGFSATEEVAGGGVEAYVDYFRVR